MEHIKQRYKIGLLVALCLLFFSSSAFFVTKIETDNVISFGNIKVQLLNHMIDENGNEIQANKEEDLLKNKNVSRIIKVKNVCQHSAYIRVRLNMQGNKDLTNYPASEYVEYKFNNDAWIEKDGWFYYNVILKSGETSKNLMDGISFDVDKLTSDYPGSKITWTVEVQAVQSENNSDNVLIAKGWPEGSDNK